MSDIEKEWLTTGEVAKSCGVTLPTVRQWIDAGKLPASRPGGRRMVRRADVEAFLAAAAVKVSAK